MKCGNCKHYHHEWCSRVHDSPDPDLERFCDGYEAATNADRIRAYSDEELAENFASRCCPLKDQFYNCGEINKYDFSWEDCKSCWLDWLKQEVDV